MESVPLAKRGKGKEAPQAQAGGGQNRAAVCCGIARCGPEGDGSRAAPPRRRL
ncbi:hypothetical protein DESPIG_02677 [Desulfovibrio piger ATCC 29098]|uniref:Uncharacterized protein n=1 Tax=Desulfovibrio piger ATCC 29098 TaxID=411464 RepID=B6WX51_9BACT|nr:hypothetical protein DESPIG_02677 [Desulfovibrio piger ATCC 29098]